MVEGKKSGLSWKAQGLHGCIAVALALAATPARAEDNADIGRIEAAMQSSIRSDRDLNSFYKAHGYRPLWVHGDALSPAADAFVKTLEDAGDDGLDPRDYDIERLRNVIEDAHQGSPKALAKAERMLSRAYVDYVRDLRRPRDTTLTYVDAALSEPASTREILDAAAAAPSMSAHLDAVRRVNPLYGQLKDGLAVYRAKWGQLPRIEIPSGPALKMGSKGERVRLLRERLGLSGAGAFDQDVADTIKAFRKDHGLGESGIADAATIALLNRNPAELERLIGLNLERARALPADARRYLVVDAAAAQLLFVEDGKVRDTMRVIVGKTAEPTPMMAGLIRYAVLNPYWNVPPDLVRERIAPNVLKLGESYLKEKGYEILSDWSDDPRILSPDEVDWAAVAQGRQELAVRQLPGPGNMMGRIKFMFPNQFGVYLHDTPDKSLFTKADRKQSSGCVRLEHPEKLAQWLFGEMPAPRSGAPEEHIDLPQPVPVYITYFTAAPAGRGITFRDDVYGRDRPLLADRDARRLSR